MKLSHKKVKMAPADSETETAIVVTILCRIWNVYTSKAFLSMTVKSDLISLLGRLPSFSRATCFLWFCVPFKGNSDATARLEVRHF